MTVSSTISPLLKTGLRFIGVWPGVSRVMIYTFMSFLFVLLCFQYLYISMHFNLSELFDLVDSLMTTFISSLMLLKLISLRVRCPVIHEILEAMDNDWHGCINVERHLYMMTNKANIAHFCSNCMMSINVFTSVFYFVSDIIIRSVNLIDNNNGTSRQLPLKVQVPFKADESPIFEVLFMIEFLFVIINSFTMAAINGLISSLVLHISGQIDIICEEFRIFSDQISTCKSSESTLRILIKRHNNIISFSDNIEKIFSIIALMQFLWDTTIICCLGFIIIISFYNKAGVFVLTKISLTYIAVTIEMFILCCAGEYLSIKSNLITNGAYDVLWYDMTSKQNKIIIFIIMRSQMLLTLTAGKFMNLSLETFTNIMKTALSFTSVFHAIY